MIEALIFVVFPFCMAFAAISDMLSMTIANRVALALVAAFAITAPMTGMSPSAIGLHFAAGAAVLIVTFGLFVLGGMGGGDAKLLAATAVYMGFGINLMQYLVYSAIIGGVLTIAILAYRKSAFVVFTGHNRFMRNFANDEVGIPYGIALGAGGLLVYPQTDLMMWAVARLTGF